MEKLRQKEKTAEENLDAKDWTIPFIDNVWYGLRHFLRWIKYIHLPSHGVQDHRTGEKKNAFICPRDIRSSSFLRKKSAADIHHPERENIRQSEWFRPDYTQQEDAKRWGNKIFFWLRMIRISIIERISHTDEFGTQLDQPLIGK